MIKTLKMSRISCSQCLRPEGYCYCERLSTYDNKCPVWIFQHPNEVSHAIGTARIAHLSLNNSVLLQGKNLSESDELTALINKHTPLLVFPSEDSVPLSDSTNISRPLLFLDATWKKAKRMVYESPELQALTHVHVVSHERSRYKIRKAPLLVKSFNDDKNKSRGADIAPTVQPLSTLEAVVTSLRRLEKTPGKYQSMLNVMDWVIQQQIDKMGKDVYSKNYR